MMNHAEIRLKYSRRNPATLNMIQFFCDTHLHPELREAVEPVRKLAFQLVNKYPDGNELLEALKHLREARSSILRHHLICVNFVLPQQRPESLEDLQE